MTQEIGELLGSKRAVGEDMGSNDNIDPHGQWSTWSCSPQPELVVPTDPNNIGNLCPEDGSGRKI